MKSLTLLTQLLALTPKGQGCIVKMGFRMAMFLSFPESCSFSIINFMTLPIPVALNLGAYASTIVTLICYKPKVSMPYDISVMK